MEKIIVAIRTLNDNLKIVATQVEKLGEQLNALEKRVDGSTQDDTTIPSIDRRVAKLEADTETRIAELTARVYALENAGPEEATVGDDIGDALDDIVGLEETPTVVEETPTVVEETPTVVEETPTVVEETPTTEETPTMCPNVDDFIAECLGQTTPTVAFQGESTPTPKKTPAKTKAVVASAVQRRAFARQYMVENGAKVEDLRSPAKIEEVMKTAEFQSWVASK